MDVEILPADLFLIDSNKKGPKFVKFMMTAPTIFHHLWRKIRGTQEIPLYYHVGMFLNSVQTMEQQWKVEYDSAVKRLRTKNNMLVVRYKKALPEQRAKCCNIAVADLDKKWDVLNAFGKMLTWLTGVPYFARYMEVPNAEICVNRGAYWWREAFGEKFGVKKHSELTTHQMYKYIKAHPEKFEIVYEQVNGEEL